MLSHSVVPHPLHKLPVNPINWGVGPSILLALARIALIKDSQEQPTALVYLPPWVKTKQSQNSQRGTQQRCKRCHSLQTCSVPSSESQAHNVAGKRMGQEQGETSLTGRATQLGDRQHPPGHPLPSTQVCHLLRWAAAASCRDSG